MFKYNYQNSRHYPSSCILFKARRFGVWILSPSSDGTYAVGPDQRQRLALSLEANVPRKDGDRIQSRKRRVLNKRQDDG
jgi:hypothetical protein